MSVEFGEAVAAYAASLVAARRALDTATARLTQVYAADDTLRSLPTPGFRLAEAQFDVPYVVESATTEAAEPVPELPGRPFITIANREVASLLRGVDEYVGERLNGVLERYAELTRLYQRARNDPEILRETNIPTLERPPEQDLLSLRTGASAMARDRLDRILADYDDVRGTLLATAEAIVQAPRTRVLVLLESAALAEVSPDRIQRARFTFRDASASTVDVDGQPVIIAE